MLRIAHWLTIIALAELVLALAGAALIALGGRAHRLARATGQAHDDSGLADRTG